MCHTEQNWQNWIEIPYLTVEFLTFTNTKCGFVSARIFRHIQQATLCSREKRGKRIYFYLSKSGMQNDNSVAGESGKNRRSDLISPSDPRKDQVDLNHSWHVCLTCSYNLSTRKTAPVARRAIPGLNSSHRQKVLSTV